MTQDARGGRARRADETRGNPGNLSGADDDPTLSQQAPNIPLPPFAAPDPVMPSAGPMAAQSPTPPLPQVSTGTGGAPGPQWPGQPPAPAAGRPGINLAWAAQTLFALIFTSMILLVLLVATTANAIHSTPLVVWTVVIVVVLNIVYAAVVFSLARRSPMQTAKWPFFGPFRQP